MATLHADYGYDFFELELTEDEARQIKEKKNFSKVGSIWRETQGGMVDAYWSFDFDNNEHWVHCEDGASFSINDFSINQE